MVGVSLVCIVVGDGWCQSKAIDDHGDPSDRIIGASVLNSQIQRVDMHITAVCLAAVLSVYNT